MPRDNLLTVYAAAGDRIPSKVRIGNDLRGSMNSPGVQGERRALDPGDRDRMDSMCLTRGQSRDLGDPHAFQDKILVNTRTGHPAAVLLTALIEDNSPSIMVTSNNAHCGKVRPLGFRIFYKERVNKY